MCKMNEIASALVSGGSRGHKIAGSAIVSLGMLWLACATGCYYDEDWDQANDSSPAPAPSPGDVDAQTIDRVMVGRVYSVSYPNGETYALLAFEPADGQVCIAYGAVNTIAWDFSTLNVYTAQVSLSEDGGVRTFYGSLYEPGSQYHKFGSYRFRPDDSLPEFVVASSTHDETHLLASEISYEMVLSHISSSCEQLPEDDAPAAPSPTYLENDNANLSQRGRVAPHTWKWLR